MATIVCHKTKEVKPVGATEYRLYDVVDGQQRLTTLILILKCIELALRSDSEERKELQRVLVKRDGNLVLLQTNNVNEYIFNSFLRDGKEPSKSDIHTKADENLRNAIQNCTQFIRGWKASDDGLVMLLRLVQNRLGFVVYDTEDSRVVHSIFEVLNSRGLAVDWLDKCKSVLMGRAFELADSTQSAEATIDSLQKLWGNVYREVAVESTAGDQILRVTATLHYGPIKGKPRPADDSLEQLRAECTSADQPRKISERIYDVTKKLVSIEQDLLLGPVAGILQARILAVALKSTDSLNEAERSKVLSQWERVTFRIFGLCAKDSRTKVGEYIRLATKVTNKTDGASRYSEIMESLRELGREYSAENAVNEWLRNRDSYESSPDLCRYMLWRYEEYLASQLGNDATVDDHARQAIWRMRSEDSIEHIFPQNPESGGAWEGKMRDSDGELQTVADHVGRIGNLILLPQSLNSEARSVGFQEKKSVYEKHNLRMVREVLARPDWTLAEIEHREERIAAWAKTVWSDLAD